MGSPLNDLVGISPYGSSLLPRRIQSSARIQLGRWRNPSEINSLAGFHRLFASLGPVGPMGGNRGNQHDGIHTGFGDQVRFVLLGGKQIGAETLLRWYVLHVLMLPFVLVIFLAIHSWRVRKDGGISGPL